AGGIVAVDQAQDLLRVLSDGTHTGKCREGEVLGDLGKADTSLSAALPLIGLDGAKGADRCQQQGLQLTGPLGVADIAADDEGARSQVEYGDAFGHRTGFATGHPG